MISGKGYLFEAERKFEPYEYELGNPDVAEVILRMRVSTICGSDLHTYLGDRTMPTPINLGHEGVGTIEKLGNGVKFDAAGNELSEGDTVLFLPYIWCNKCYYCLRGDKTNCQNRKSIGSIPFNREKPVPTGTFSEYLLLPRGTEFIKVEEKNPDFLSLGPINCSLSTMIHAFSDHLPKVFGKSIAVIGAGALGLYSAAIANYSGAEKIIVIDKNRKRLELSMKFGATDIIDTSNLEMGQLHTSITEIADGRGVDAVIDVAGYPPLAEEGIKFLDKGGTFLEVGTIFPAKINNIQLDEFVKKGIKLSGMRTYEIRHLQGAYNFYRATQDRYPFKAITGKTYPLSSINEAFDVAKEGAYVRVGLTNELF
ncbi:MAG: zinc-binding dehydrogenase [Candidatus Micrarchaeaceae archaeon]